MAKFHSLLILFLLTSCNPHSNFDKLYKAGQYDEAYHELKFKPSNSLSYKERELKVLLFLSINNTGTYLPLLDDTLLQIANTPELKDLYNLSRAWIRYISAETREDFQNVFNLLPTMPFKEQKIEHLRLLIQSHSLSRLEKFQEALAYLQASGLTSKSSDLLYIKGLAQLELDQNKQAASSFHDLIKITSNIELSALAYYYLGKIEIIQNNIDKAQRYFLKSWELDPYNSNLNFELGKIFQDKSYNDLHYRFYRSSLRLNENLAESWYRLNIQ